MKIAALERKKWRNWAHTSESRPERIFFPSSIEEVRLLVKQANEQKKTIRVAGAGHSFAKLVETDEWLVSLDRLTGIEKINELENTATVYAGTRLKELGEALGKRGYAQENLGDINVQTIAGAISTGTHGTGIQFGSIATQVIELVLVSAQGELLVFSEKENPDTFKASLVSLGMLGIVVKVTLKLIKSPVYAFKSYKLPYYMLEEQLYELIDSHRHFEFFMFPYSDLVQVKTMNITDDRPQRTGLYWFKNLVLENYLFWFVSEACRIVPKMSRPFSRLSAIGVGTSAISAYSHQLFATPRLVRFREMEYAIPLRNFRDALRDIRLTMEKNNYAVHFPIECRMAKADDIWLSPSYQRDSTYIAFHMYKGMPYENYFREMEKIMQTYAGRPHWGKMHHASIEQLQKLYPKLQAFLALRKQLDPNHVFLNPYLKELFGIEMERGSVNREETGAETGNMKKRIEK